MLTPPHIDLLHRYAVVPEHLPHYVEAVSPSEVHLHEGFLCYVCKREMVFVGYPIGSSEEELPRAFESACIRFRPRIVRLIAPSLWLPPSSLHQQVEDMYYVMDLPTGPLHPRISYMLRRAQREVSVQPGGLEREHTRIIEAFVRQKAVSRAHAEIFRRVPHYIMSCPSARLLEARRRGTGELVSFLVYDVGSELYAFWLFHFRSMEAHVPGASDLLFHEMAQRAFSDGKSKLNLGLGINDGIRRFKQKWGGRPLVPYRSAVVFREGEALQSLISKL